MFGTIFWTVVVILAALDFILKGIALWKAGNHRQGIWYTAMYILNTAGILPAIYLLFFQKKKGKK